MVTKIRLDRVGYDVRYSTTPQNIETHRTQQNGLQMAIGSALSETTEPLSILLYGPAGTGKTTSALGATRAVVKGERVLVINAEAGVKRRPLQKHGVDTSLIDVWPSSPADLTYSNLLREVLEPLHSTNGESGYGAVVLDSVTEIAKRLLDDVVKSAENKARRLGKDREPMFVGLEDHGAVASMMRTLTRSFRDAGIHVIFTALERRDVDKNTSETTYGPALGPALSVDLQGQVDVVGYTYTETTPDGEVFVCARFNAWRARKGKDRYGVLPVAMITPSFDRILGYIEGTITKDNDPERARFRTAMAANGADASATSTETPAGSAPETAAPVVEDATTPSGATKPEETETTPDEVEGDLDSEAN